MRESSSDGHLEHLRHTHTRARNGEHVVLETPPTARWTDQAHVSQELHLDGLETLARTGFATPAVDVEGEVRRREAQRQRCGLFSVQGPDQIPGLGVRRRV